MARIPFDPSSARAFLESRGISTARIKTEAYLKRLYRAAQKAEREHRPIPKRSELRGHPKITPKYLPEDSAKRRRDHWYIVRPPKMEEQARLLREAGDFVTLRDFQFTRFDLQRLVKKAGKRRDYPLVVKGWVKKYPGWAPGPDNPIRPQTAQIPVSSMTMHEWLTSGILMSGEASDNILDFLNELFAPTVEWVDVQSIAIPMFYE